MKPLIFYRTSAACRFSPNVEGGAVFVDFAAALPGTSGKPQKGQRRYDWQNKICLALNVEEVLDLGVGCRAALSADPAKVVWSAYHDAPGLEPKSMRLWTPKESGKATAFLGAQINPKQKGRKAAVNLDQADLNRLSALLPFAAAALLGWVTSTPPEWLEEGKEPMEESETQVVEPAPETQVATPPNGPLSGLDWAKTARSAGGFSILARALEERQIIGRPESDEIRENCDGDWGKAIEQLRKMAEAAAARKRQPRS